MAASAHSPGLVLYDDSCGICRAFIARSRAILERHEFVIAPLQSDGIAEQLQLSPEHLLDDLRLLKSDGTMLSGADAYRYVLSHIWWAFPLYALSMLPVTGSIFNWVYGMVNKNRHRISGVCGLKP